MMLTDDIFSISVLVTCPSSDEANLQEIVAFKVLQQGCRFKAIPLLADNERVHTGLPEIFSFAFTDGRVIPDGQVNEHLLEVMGNMVWELSILEALDQ